MKEEAKPILQSPPERKILVGIIGERIVAHYLRKAGHTVEESLNVFDTEKDMLVDGLPVEVKTQVPLVIEDSFSIDYSQKKKIMNSHRVYFVSIPTKLGDDLEGCIFELNPQEEFKAHRRDRADGSKIICIPRRQTALKIVARITDTEILEQLKRLSTSYL